MFTAVANRLAYFQKSFSLLPRAHFHAGTSAHAASIGLDTPAFQQHLKQLKLRLHPDRVAAHPEARAANEQSFKVLSQYLEELRGDGGSPAEQYRLDFYVKRDGESAPDWQDLTANESTLHASARFVQDPRYWQLGQEAFEPGFMPPQHQAAKNRGIGNGSEQQDADNPLCRLTIRLPPPPPHAASRLPAAVRRAFRRLFSALQLDDIFVDDGDTTADHRKVQREVSAEALADFLPDAIELARQGEAVRHSLPSQQLRSIQSAFWMAKRMRVVFDGAAESQPPLARIAALEALGRALDRSGNGALRDCTVTVGEGAGLDVLGRVWLPFDQEAAWADVLAGVDVGLVWERRRQFERVQGLESSAAVAFGVAAVFTSHRLSLSSAYLDFLEDVHGHVQDLLHQVAVGAFQMGGFPVGVMLCTDQTGAVLSGEVWSSHAATACRRLQEHGATSGQICGGDMALLSLCAMPAPDMPEMRLLHEAGVVQASVGSCAEEVAAFLAAKGPVVADAMQRRRMAERGLRDLQRRVELRLRLQQLKRSPQLSAVQFESGCYRMLDHREFLSKYLEGSVVQLSDRNCIIPGQHVVSIAWDFDP